jgi:hypothetical protein
MPPLCKTAYGKHWQPKLENWAAVYKIHSRYTKFQLARTMLGTLAPEPVHSFLEPDTQYLNMHFLPSFAE